MLAIASTVVTKVPGHDAGVAAILVAEHGAVGGHGHSRQHHGHREHESRRARMQWKTAQMMAGITSRRNTEQVQRRGPPMRSRAGRFASDEPMMSSAAGVVMEPSVFSASPRIGA